MAMAHGVEARHPFLDRAVAEVAGRIPPRLKMRGLDEKHILKKAVAPLVPASVLARPKQPYRAPDVQSFFDPATGAARFPYVDRLLSPGEIARHGIFHPAVVARLVEKIRRGGATGTRDAMALVVTLSTQLVLEQIESGFEGPSDEQ